MRLERRPLTCAIKPTPHESCSCSGLYKPCRRYRSVGWRCSLYILSQVPFRLLGSPTFHGATFIPRKDCVINFFSPRRAKSRVRHLLGAHPAIEIFFTEVTKSKSGLLETGPLFVRLFGDLRRFVVPNVRIQSGNQHERILHIFRDRSLSGSIPAAQCSSKELMPSANKRTELRKLKMMTGLTHSVRSFPERQRCRWRHRFHHLHATIVRDSLCVRFTFPGIIDEPGSFSGIRSSPSPQRGPEASQRMSLAIFMQDAARLLRAPLAKANSL